jgi:hypothetical protein
MEPKHYQGPPQSFRFEEERHTKPEKHGVPTVPLLAFEEPSPENVHVQQHGFFTDAPGVETALVQPSTVMPQDPPPVPLPSSDAPEIAPPVSGASQPDAEVALPAVAQVAQPETAQAPRTSQDPPFSAPHMEWDATR